MAYELDMLQRLEQVRDGLKRLEKTINTIANGMAVQADRMSDPDPPDKTEPEPEPVLDCVGNVLHVGDTVFIASISHPGHQSVGKIVAIYENIGMVAQVDLGDHKHTFPPSCLVRIPNPKPDADGYREQIIRAKCTATQEKQ